MVLSQTAINAIEKKTTIFLDLAKSLGFSEQWVQRSLKKNKANGPLTTYAAVKVIREETGLSDEEILEETGAPVKV